MLTAPDQNPKAIFETATTRLRISTRARTALTSAERLEWRAADTGEFSIPDSLESRKNARVVDWPPADLNLSDDVLLRDESPASAIGTVVTVIAHDIGAVAVSVTDYPKSGARASALGLATLIEQQAHVETLLHYSCRDRNLLGMQSDLLGAHAMGLRNLLLTTGDPPRQGSASSSTFEVDAIGLTNMVAQLNRGLDVGGQSIGSPTRFHIGVAVNPFAVSGDAEWRRLEYKVEAGAEFLMTPPIFMRNSDEVTR